MVRSFRFLLSACTLRRYYYSHSRRFQKASLTPVYPYARPPALTHVIDIRARHGIRPARGQDPRRGLRRRLRRLDARLHVAMWNRTGHLGEAEAQRRHLR